MTPCINRKCTLIKNVFYKVKKVHHHALTKHILKSKMLNKKK